MGVTNLNDTGFIREALTLATQARERDEVPVGAVVVYQGEIVGRGSNHTIGLCDPTAHAEIIALREAASYLGNYRLIHCSLYTTLEPCAMCAGAIIHARIQQLVFGAHDAKSGAAGTVCNLFEAGKFNHLVEVRGGVLSQECGALLSDFFQMKRRK